MNRSALISYYYQHDKQKNVDVTSYVQVIEDNEALDCGVVASTNNGFLKKIGIYSDITDQSNCANQIRYLMNTLSEKHYVRVYYLHNDHIQQDNNNVSDISQNKNILKANFNKTQQKQKTVNDTKLLYVDVGDLNIKLDEVYKTYAIEIGLVNNNTYLMRINVNMSHTQQHIIESIKFNLIDNIPMKLENSLIQTDGRCNIILHLQLNDDIPNNASLNGEFTVSSNMPIGKDKNIMHTESVSLTDVAIISQKDSKTFKIVLPIYLQYTQKYNNNDFINLECMFNLTTSNNDSIKFDKSYKVEFVNELNQQNLGNLYRIIAWIVLFILCILYALNLRINGFIYPQILIYLNNKLISIFTYLMEYFDLYFVDKNLQQLGLGLITFGPSIMSSQGDKNRFGLVANKSNTNSLVNVTYKIIEKA